MPPLTPAPRFRGPHATRQRRQKPSAMPVSDAFSPSNGAGPVQNYYDDIEDLPAYALAESPDRVWTSDLDDNTSEYEALIATRSARERGVSRQTAYPPRYRRGCAGRAEMPFDHRHEGLQSWSSQKMSSRRGRQKVKAVCLLLCLTYPFLKPPAS